MNVNSGQVVTLTDLDELERLYGIDRSEWVEVSGTQQQVDSLSANVRLGAGVRDKRRARAKAQRASRKRNR